MTDKYQRAHEEYEWAFLRLKAACRDFCEPIRKALGTEQS